MNENLKHISGTIERVIYYDEDETYSVLQLMPDGALVSITVVGMIPNPVPGQAIEVWGKWDKHKEYGRQFKVENFKSGAPKTPQAIVKYLSSELVEGIGKTFAERIVEKFGKDTIDIILNHPEKLRKVSGIGEKRANTIVNAVRKAYSEQASLQHLATFLMGHGFGIGMVKRIWRRYGEAALNVVKDNPYILAEEVWGIGFATADKLAISLGITQNDPRRIAAGILYTLQRATDDGHCYLPRDELIESATNILQQDKNFVAQVLDEAASVEKVINDNGKIYVPQIYASEQNVAQMLVNISASSPRKSVSKVTAESLFNEVQRTAEIHYNGEQRDAIISAICGKMLIITGGPGTGKTTIIKAMLAIAKRLYWRVELAAPTGRAAKRLEETTGHSASTIHRLLKFNPGMSKFEFSQGNPIDADMLILDEVSMIDIELMWRVLTALPAESRLVLVGDADQLPSVGPGAILRDIIASRQVHTIKLGKIMRQDEHGLIVRNAHRILHGEAPIIKNRPEDDFFLLIKDTPEEAQKAILRLVCERIPNKYKLNPVQDIQVITPMHKGLCGAKALNDLLRELSNPNAKMAKRLPFAAGDKVMQIANNYDLGVFNGDIGVVIATDEDRREVTVDFGDSKPTYDSSFLSQLQLAYAITVHKSQGSEYPAVVMPILTEHFIMLARNLLYTGITRAKKLLILVGSSKALNIALSNNRPMKRWTGLTEHIVSFGKKPAKI